MKTECSKCGKYFSFSPSHKRKFCSNRCSNSKQKNTGRTHFKKGMIPWNKSNGTISSQGYRVIGIGGKRILEHRYIWCKYNHPYIPDGFDIHHLDGDKLNNNPSNLVLMDKSDHAKLHQVLIKFNGGKKA